MLAPRRLPLIELELDAERVGVRVAWRLLQAEGHELPLALQERFAPEASDARRWRSRIVCPPRYY